MTTLTPLSLEEGRARRKMSIAIGLVLAFLVVAFYAVTLVRLQDNVAKRIDSQGGANMSSGQTVTPSSVNTKRDK